MFGLFSKSAALHVAVTDSGKRYTHNEDAFFLPEANATWEITQEMIDASGRLYLLCDGMGGGKAGEVASSLAAGWIARDFYARPLGEEDPAERLAALVCDINARLYVLAQNHEAYEGMGTTLVAAHLSDRVLTLISIGDSRGYIFREETLIQLTEDHSEIWPLYKAGALTKDELRTHPRSNLLSKALVVSETLTSTDLFITTETLREGDLLLICSDGLTDMVPEEEIQEILGKKKKLEWKAEQLVAAANRHGGRDNITAVLARA